MKIEIAENMLYSWLRHCMGCQVVQTNYKKAKQWKSAKDMESVFNDFQVDTRFQNCLFEQKNKNGEKIPQKFETVLKAAECDLVGILFGDNNTIKIFAYESAFHGAGAHYTKEVDNKGTGKSKKENVTPQKVVQKLFKNYLMMRSFFPNSEVELAFVSPLIKDKYKTQIDDYVKDLKDFFIKHRDTAVNLKIFTGKKFKDEIWKPLDKIIDEIADESELFVRAVQLLRLMDKIK